jgi:kynurenine formamidase
MPLDPGSGDIDAWSWARPLPFLEKEFKENQDPPRVIWEAHFAGIETGYCHMEKLAKLSAIGRSYRFTVVCFPIKIKRASAGWCRPVAISIRNPALDTEGSPYWF